MVADIITNFDAIYQGNGRALILAKRTPTRGQAYIQLEPSEAGDFYDVKTAAPSRKDQFKNREPLWERAGTNTSPDETGTVPPSDQSGGTSLAKDASDLKQSARGSYTPATNTIRLFQSANMSTFIHESGHQWLFQMADDLGDARLLPEARAQIVADLGAVLGHLGVKGVDPTTATPEQLKAALSVEQHETFARSVEAYLREGKAPSKELRSAFRRLSSWLVQIYRSLRGLNVEMTAEIRGVMDRLLANETALAAERQGREVAIAPEIWRAATEAERKTLGAALSEAKDEAFMKVWAAQTANEARRRKKAYQAERTAMRESLAPKVAERPEYRALEAVRQVPLDRAALNEAFGQGDRAPVAAEDDNPRRRRSLRSSGRYAGF